MSKNIKFSLNINRSLIKIPPNIKRSLIIKKFLNIEILLNVKIVMDLNFPLDIKKTEHGIRCEKCSKLSIQLSDDVKDVILVSLLRTLNRFTPSSLFSIVNFAQFLKT